MNVLSLFDGISAGQLALEKLGIEVNKYYASEIDKYAIAVTQYNFPDTIQLGNVIDVKAEDLPQIDLLIGGSPCQGFSRAGKQLNFEDKRSKLFFEFVRLLKEVKPKYFLLENVKMKKEWQDIITEYIGVEPVLINAKHFVPQSRPRLFWTNIPINKKLPTCSQVLSDILQDEVEDKFYLSQKGRDLMLRNKGGRPRWKSYPNHLDGVAGCLTSGMWRGVPYGVIMELNRRLTPIECERLQGKPDNYTKYGMMKDKKVEISNTQRYKQCGNGWCTDVIKFIFEGLKNESSQKVG